MLPTLVGLERLIYAARTYSWLVDPRFWFGVTADSIDRPIFLLGTQGGGLTLLSRMLRRHPEVVSAAGNSDYWTSADEMQNVFGPVLPAQLTGLRFKAPPHPVLSAPRSWTFAARELFALYRESPDSVTPELAKALRRLIGYSSRRFGQGPQTARFVDKSQSFAVRAGFIWALLQEFTPRFVLVPRDPYVSVYRAATGKAADMRRLADKLPYPERIDICAEHYANSMQSVLDDADQLGFPLKILKFESLVAEPRETLRDVCEFCELSFSERLLPTADDRLPVGSRYRDRWYPIRSDVNEAYEPFIDETTIERVNVRVSSLLPRLGYTLRAPEQ